MSQRYRSVSAMSWAAEQRTGKASANHILMSMASLVSDKPMRDQGREWPAFHCWAGIDALAERSQQDRKTVAASIGRLIETGHIEVAGHSGTTGRVKVFRLLVNEPKNGLIERSAITPFFPGNQPKNGCLPIRIKEGSNKEGSTPLRSPASQGKANSRQPRGMTLAAWIATMKAAGQKPISSGDPVIDYAMEIGLTPDMLHVQLHHFTQVFTQDRAGKQHTDWQAQFRESVRGNWFGLWHFDPSLGPTWTSKGQQALSSYAASQQAQPTEQASQPAATPASSAAGDHGTVGGDPKAQQPASVRPASGPASPENGPTGRFSGPEGSSGATDPRKPAQNGPTADQKRSAYPPLPRMTA